MTPEEIAEIMMIVDAAETPIDVRFVYDQGNPLRFLKDDNDPRVREDACAVAKSI